MFVSPAKTAQEFREEIVKDMRETAARMITGSRYANKRDTELAAARENALSRYADYLESIVFGELTRTADEAQPEIDLQPVGGFKAASQSAREVTPFPTPDQWWP